MMGTTPGFSCPRCGAQIKRSDADDNVVCEYCGSPIPVGREDRPTADNVGGERGQPPTEDGKEPENHPAQRNRNEKFLSFFDVVWIALVVASAVLGRVGLRAGYILANSFGIAGPMLKRVMKNDSGEKWREPDSRPGTERNADDVSCL